MKEVFKKVVSFCWKALLIFFAVSILSVLLFRWIPIPFTPLMGIRLIEQLVEGKSLKCSKDWEPIENISPNLPLAVVCSVVYGTSWLRS